MFSSFLVELGLHVLPYEDFAFRCLSDRVIIFCSNKITLVFQALDTFNTAVVSPIYYVMFTTLTILASVIMFKVYFILVIVSEVGYVK